MKTNEINKMVKNIGYGMQHTRGEGCIMQTQKVQRDTIKLLDECLNSRPQFIKHSRDKAEDLPFDYKLWFLIKTINNKKR